MSDTQSAPAPSRFSYLSLFLPILALAGTFFYALSESANDSYMRHLGLDGNLFSKDKDLSVLNGYKIFFVYTLNWFASIIFLIILPISAKVFSSNQNKQKNKNSKIEEITKPELNVIFRYLVLTRGAFFTFLMVTSLCSFYMQEASWLLIAFSIVISMGFILEGTSLTRKIKITSLSRLAYVLLSALNDKSKFPEGSVESAKRNAVFSYLSGVIVAASTLFIFGFFLAPITFGFHIGKEEANKKIQYLSRAGTNGEDKMTVKKNGSVLMEGYLLASGDKFSAFYNPKTNTVHTVDMDGIELTKTLSMKSLTVDMITP